MIIYGTSYGPNINALPSFHNGGNLGKKSCKKYKIMQKTGRCFEIISIIENRGAITNIATNRSQTLP